jgi:hypothetical protein
VLAGHGVRAEALDLTRPWFQIREELLVARVLETWGYF